MMTIDDIVASIRAYQPQKILLFGSQAYGSPNQDSDFDIAIIKKTTKPYHERLMAVRRLVRTTTPIDFFVFTPEEVDAAKDTNPLINEILTKGRIVYEQ